MLFGLAPVAPLVLGMLLKFDELTVSKSSVTTEMSTLGLWVVLVPNDTSEEVALLVLDIKDLWVKREHTRSGRKLMSLSVSPLRQTFVVRTGIFRPFSYKYRVTAGPISEKIINQKIYH